MAAGGIVPVIGWQRLARGTLIAGSRAGASTAVKDDLMSKLNMASGLAAALTLVVALFSVDGSGAVAQSRTPVPLSQIPQSSLATPQAAGPEAASAGAPDDLYSAVPVVQADPRENAQADTDDDADMTLAELVRDQDADLTLSRDMECLAGAIYFESKGETLEGQLAVGRVVVNRARSGRFPSSYCGVVFQRAQFSFVRGKALPAFNRDSRAWKRAVAIAQIAHEGAWTSPAKGALFFHATRVSPRWRLTRIARIDNHIFYR